MVQIPLQQGWYLQQAAADFCSQQDPGSKHSSCTVRSHSLPHQSLQGTHLSLGASSIQSLGSSQLLQRSPLCPGPCFVGWKEWLWHLLSRLKFGSRMPVLFMQNWHVSLSWAMWPRFQPLYLQNITHVRTPLSSPWFQRDYSHVHTYPGPCRAGANLAAFSWFTPPLWRWKSDTGAAQQEKEVQSDTSSVFSFHIAISTVTTQLAGRSAPLYHQGIAAYQGLKWESTLVLEIYCFPPAIFVKLIIKVSHPHPCSCLYIFSLVLELYFTEEIIIIKTHKVTL